MALVINGQRPTANGQRPTANNARTMVLGILTLLQVGTISGVDERCAFKFSAEGSYGFSHLAEENLLPYGGIDYHVRIPIVQTGWSN